QRADGGMDEGRGTRPGRGYPAVPRQVLRGVSAEIAPNSQSDPCANSQGWELAPWELGVDGLLRWKRRFREILFEPAVLTHRTNLLVTQEPRVRDREVPVRIPRLGVRARIVDDHIELERRRIHALVAFGEVQLLRVRMAHLIEP